MRRRRRHEGGWHQDMEWLCSSDAQATLEYAITMFALLAIIVGLAAVWRAAESGKFSALVEQAASHTLDGTGPLDIALF